MSKLAIRTQSPNDLRSDAAVTIFLARPSRAADRSEEKKEIPMKKLTLAITTVILLAGCSDGGNNQSDPVDNTPASGPTAPAQTDADPTPQTGSGGQSPVDSSSGTEKR
ncbi:membrane lipoprotein lipid attachment site-containing protein [Pseudorhizobium sp. NPDC055634]